MKAHIRNGKIIAAHERQILVKGPYKYRVVVTKTLPASAAETDNTNLPSDEGGRKSTEASRKSAEAPRKSAPPPKDIQMAEGDGICPGSEEDFQTAGEDGICPGSKEDFQTAGEDGIRPGSEEDFQTAGEDETCNKKLVLDTKQEFCHVSTDLKHGRHFAAAHRLLKLASKFLSCRKKAGLLPQKKAELLPASTEKVNNDIFECKFAKEKNMHETIVF